MQLKLNQSTWMWKMTFDLRNPFVGYEYQQHQQHLSLPNHESVSPCCCRCCGPRREQRKVWLPGSPLWTSAVEMASWFTFWPMKGWVQCLMNSCKSSSLLGQIVTLDRVFDLCYEWLNPQLLFCTLVTEHWFSSKFKQTAATSWLHSHPKPTKSSKSSTVWEHSSYLITLYMVVTYKTFHTNFRKARSAVLKVQSVISF